MNKHLVRLTKENSDWLKDKKKEHSYFISITTLANIELDKARGAETTKPKKKGKK